MKNVPLYGRDEVFALLDYPGCIVAVREAMKSFTAKAPQQPLRTIVPIAPAKLLGVMPGVLSRTRRQRNQHPSFLLAGLQRRAALSPGLRTRRQADRRDRALPN